ncbi:hypothetical protein J6590_075891 [Homalodisca vitripennis]|nr:hypothetical protein J6590_075891 [Homalodisca vitripennis]
MGIPSYQTCLSVRPIGSGRRPSLQVVMSSCQPHNHLRTPWDIISNAKPFPNSAGRHFSRITISQLCGTSCQPHKNVPTQWDIISSAKPSPKFAGRYVSRITISQLCGSSCQPHKHLPTLRDVMSAS